MGLEIAELFELGAAVEAREAEHAGMVRTEMRLEVGGRGLTLPTVRAVVGEDPRVELLVLLQIA